ncbi:uncharacterized protein MKK02DRAFT_31845 [Dioszegia hungarica]|uniref:Uncharacterized protein n=1 Tax=Dioszegia hungarica TaxID=4972 RepID=A0AA38HD49_9TREE|nr:uncharacterized protein MKK02DRAFT_31845 [Dioszegia hungarica]KAI9638410.1 hypothetical protein MKK02DRAFT_31845 [Dioszegia hungarica]
MPIASIASVLAGRNDDTRAPDRQNTRLYTSKGPSREDIFQKNFGTCWFTAVTRVSQDAIKKRIIAYEALKKRADAPYAGDGFIKKATYRITRPASIGGYSDVDIASADVLKLSDSQTSSYKPGGWWVAGFEQAALLRGFPEPLQEFPKTNRDAEDALWMLTGNKTDSFWNAWGARIMISHHWPVWQAFLKCDKSPVTFGTKQTLPEGHVLRWADHEYAVMATGVENGIKMYA